MRIEDGKGTGYFAQVDDSNRLSTSSVTVTEVAHVGFDHGQVFTMATPLVPVTTSECTVIWFKNTDPERVFALERMIGGWNGDSTNHNRPCYGRFYFGGYGAGGTEGEPTANKTQGAIGNVNTTSANTADALYYYWDGVGNGMTMTTNGVFVGAMILGQGAIDITFGGTILIGPGVTFGLTMQAEAAAGQASIIVTGYYK